MKSRIKLLEALLQGDPDNTKLKDKIKQMKSQYNWDLIMARVSSSSYQRKVSGRDIRLNQLLVNDHLIM